MFGAHIITFSYYNKGFQTSYEKFRGGGLTLLVLMRTRHQFCIILIGLIRLKYLCKKSFLLESCRKWQPYKYIKIAMILRQLLLTLLEQIECKLGDRNNKIQFVDKNILVGKFPYF